VVPIVYGPRRSTIRHDLPCPLCGKVGCLLSEAVGVIMFRVMTEQRRQMAPAETKKLLDAWGDYEREVNRPATLAELLDLVFNDNNWSRSINPLTAKSSAGCLGIIAVIAMALVPLFL
jgi:ADP-ribosylglycohydrolase